MTESRHSKVTAQDVARKAGVSQSAVSRAFTPDASVSPVTRQKVLKAAAELGYRPNAFARSLTTRRSDIIGVAMGNLQNPFFAAALEEITHQFARAGLRLLVFSARPDMPVEEIMQYQIEALLMLSAPLSPRLKSECQVGRVPVVMFNRSSLEPDISSVVGDNAQGAATIAAYLLAGDHRRIAYMALGQENESTASVEREAAFTAYLAAQGHRLHSRAAADFTSAGAAAAMRKLLLQPERPDAVFCANDHLAIMALQVAQAEFGLEVGRDISIVGFDDVPQASWPGISLTTFSQPIAPMVSAALDLIEDLRSGEAPPQQVVIPGDLVVRSSARRPRYTAGG
ncbi:MAG TPA: LacI family DNA-binding transcriptional regulator [Novosphingobium sp.]|nr:LacI family DNA-binding transcriptional regulator [Novosphingobium sp.]